MLSNIRASISKSILNRLSQSSNICTRVSFYNDLLSTIIRSNGIENCSQTIIKNNISTENFVKHHSDDDNHDDGNGFQNFKTKSSISWSETIGKAKKLSDYDINLVQKMLHDHTLNNIIDYKGLKNKTSFQELISHFLRTYNFQLTGLITMIFSKLFLVSTQYWPVEIIGKPKTLVQAEADIKKICECYDMISYGFYFHDLIDPKLGLSTKPSLRNLLVLIGDYFLVKSSYDVASFRQIELYKIYVQSIQKYSEGEALSLSCQNSDFSLLKKYDSYIDIHSNNDQSQSFHLERYKDSSEESKKIRKLIDYCYLTSGHLFACSLQSAFKLANFSPKIQMLAFEFGKNFGMAIKMSNQLSAICLRSQAEKKSDIKNINDKIQSTYHLNLSYFAKFPTVPVEVFEDLISEYVNRSRKQLILFCDNCQNSSLSDSSVVSSDQGALLFEMISSILNEIQIFNHLNVQQYLNNK